MLAIAILLSCRAVEEVVTRPGCPGHPECKRRALSRTRLRKIADHNGRCDWPVTRKGQGGNNDAQAQLNGKARAQ
jgi:hypothetical protein